MLSDIRMDKVYDHYLKRLAAHQSLVEYFESKNLEGYVDLALGISRSEGNYSASEHNLGPQVLNKNSKEAVFDLAKNLVGLHDANHVPDTVYKANMPYLRISLGSEMAMMLKPDKYWVGNVRTIYSHLLIKHENDRGKADEEHALYKEPEGYRPSAMEYRIWRDLYLSLDNSLRQIAELGVEEAKQQSAPIGEHVYMWADAISSYLYSGHA